MSQLKQALRVLRNVAIALSLIYVSLNSNEIHEGYLYDHVGNGVVTIKGTRGGGTGFHVKAPSGKTYILTNRHVCELKDANNQVFVISEQTGREIPKKVIEQYKEHDLCLVEPIEGIKGIKVASDAEIRDAVYILGHPGLRALTLTKGNYIGDEIIEIPIFDIKKEDCKGKFIQGDMFTKFIYGFETVCLNSFQSNAITANIFPGSSGSPVVNFRGNLVGVVFAGSRTVSDGFMVPLSFVEDFLEQY